MPTPVVSVRASPRDAVLIRAVTSRLRDDPGFRLALEGLIGPPRAASKALPRAIGKRPGGGPVVRGRRRHAPANRGPFASTGAALGAIVDRLVAVHRPLALYLFGSRATGTARPDSDFDLLLVVADGVAMSPARAYDPVAGLGVGCDIVSCTASDFAEDAVVAGTLCHEAATRGRILYRS